MSDTDRKRQERERKASLGMKWRGLWAYPEVWDAVREYAEKMNRKYERQKAKEGGHSE